MRDELAACSPASPRAQPGQREAWVMWPFDWALLPSGTSRRGCLACLVGLHTMACRQCRQCRHFKPR